MTDTKKLRPFCRALRRTAQLAENLMSIEDCAPEAVAAAGVDRLRDEFSQSLATVKTMLAEIDAP